MLALLGILAFMVLVTGLAVLTRQMDHAQLVRERTLLEAQVDANVELGRKSVAIAATNDEAIRRLDHARDAAWAAGAYPNPAGANVWVYTLDGEGAVDRIKIDRSFVAGLSSDRISLAVVRALVRLGRSLGIEITAEGVETRLQEKHLLEMGCQSLQGYLLGGPVPADAVERFRERMAA